MTSNLRILFITYIDLMKPIDISQVYRNSGDTVYYSAGISYFFGLENYSFHSNSYIRNKLSQNPNWAKENFDIAIKMYANFIAEVYNNDGSLLAEADFVKKLKIPLFVLGIGVQSDTNYSTNFLKNIEANAKKFIDTVLDSGGAITLRGNFTAHCLEKLGYKNLFVSGCPSLYLNGINFSISNKKVAKSDFKPMLNGGRVEYINERIYKTYKNCSFFDQDVYLKLIYCPYQFKNYSLLTPLLIELYKSGRIKGNMNYYPWIKSIVEGNYNFSYGSRIHGNIIALQNKIPAFIKVIDSRVREIAEFYNIPNSLEYEFNEEKDDLYDIYKSIDYTKFNETYTKRITDFVNFLDEHNIPHNDFASLQKNKYIKYLSKLEYPKKYASNVQERNKVVKKVLHRPLIYKEKIGNKRIIHIFGIKISYKIRKNKDIE